MKKMLASFTAVIALFSLALPALVPVAAQAQTVSSSFCYTFNSNLGVGRAISSADANALQQVLVAQGFWTAGTPITSYTEAVASAVVGFQQKYAAQILTPNGLAYGTGYVGVSTRAELNTLYGCSTTSSTTSSGQTFQCPSGWVCTAPTQTAPVTYQCPTGWTCTPTNTVTTTSSNPSCAVGDYSYCIPSSILNQSQYPSDYQGAPITTNTNPYNGWNYSSLTLSTVGPSQAAPGQIVTLAGSNFSASTDISIVNSSNIDYSFAPSSISANGSSMTFTVPSTLAPGSYTISLYNTTNSNQTSNTLTFSIGTSSTAPLTVGPQDQSVTFNKNFYISQTGQVILTMASDNMYSISVNGNLVGTSNLNDNFGAANVFNITPYVHQGSSNSLSITVVNQWVSSAFGYAWSLNPAGLLYQVTNNGSVVTSSDGTEQAVYMNNTDTSAIVTPNVAWMSIPGASWIWDSKLYAAATSNSSYPTNPTNPVSGAQSAILSLDGSSPLAGSVPVTNAVQGQYLALPVLVFDVNAQGGNTHLHSVSVNVSASGNGLVNAAYLYQGSNPIASAPIINGVATFSNITDGTAGASILSNTTVPFTVKVDVSGLTAANSQESVSASVTGTGITVYNPSDSAVSVSGSANGYTTTVTASGSVSAPSVSYSIIGTPAISKTNITPGAATTTTFMYTATFNVAAMATGGSVTLGLPSASSPAFAASANEVAIYKNGSQDSLSNYYLIPTYQQPNNTTLSGNGSSFTIGQNQTVTIPVTYTFTIANQVSNTYAVQIEGINSSAGLNTSMANQSAWMTSAI